MSCCAFEAFRRGRLSGLAAFLTGLALAESSGAQVPLQVVEPNWASDFCPLGDVNGDGIPDFALGNGGDEVRVRAGGSGVLLGAITAAAVGIVNQGYFGLRTETLGDVTGDGISEFMTEAALPTDFSGNQVTGKVVVLSPIGPTLVHFLTTGPAGNQFGANLEGEVDVNGDGSPDILVRANPFVPGLPGWAGEVWIFDGITGAQLFCVPGTAVNQLFGLRLTGLGDITGDGMDEWATVRSQGSYAEIGVFSGATGLKLYELTSPAGLGGDIASVPDLDFDGLPELIAVAGTPSSPTVGEVRVITATQTMFTYMPPIPTNIGQLGSSFDAAGDVDGDGYEDVVAGAPGSFQQLPPLGWVLRGRFS